MNPITSMLSEAKLFASVAPTLVKVGTNVASNLPDIEAQGKALVTGLEKAWTDARHLDVSSAEADLGAAWKAGMKIYGDVGLPREMVQSTIATASKDVPALSGLQSAIAAGENIAKQLGLPV